MGLEHHLGLTCDPVAGLVQIPCIECNVFAASRALTCADYAVFSDGTHRIPFDDAVTVMGQTGRDLPSSYRETALGGLAAACQRRRRQSPAQGAAHARGRYLVELTHEPRTRRKSMADSPEFVITLAHNKSNPKQVTLAFTLGLKSLEKGHSTAIVLLLDGVQVGQIGHVDHVDMGEPFLPVREVLSTTGRSWCHTGRARTP